MRLKRCCPNSPGNGGLVNTFWLDITTFYVFLNVGSFEQDLLSVPHIPYLGLHPANGILRSHENGGYLFDGIKVLLTIHMSPSPFFNLYRVLSFGLNLSFRKLLKVPGEQPKYTAALSKGISFSFKKSLSLFLMSFISIYMKYILRYLSCQAISLIYLIFFIASNQLK